MTNDIYAHLDFEDCDLDDIVDFFVADAVYAAEFYLGPRGSEDEDEEPEILDGGDERPID